MKILVTGGAGFIGSNLVKQLKQDNVDRVVVVDDLSTGYESNLDGLDAEFYEGSVLDQPLLAKVCSGAHAIVHLAARPSVPRSIEDPVASHHANVTGTLYVLEAARNVGAHVVLASSSSVYGDNPSLPKHEGLRPAPMSPYAASKLASESYLMSYQCVYSLTALAFRLFNVYGPGQSASHAYAAVVPEFVSRALRCEPLVVHGDGLQTRDFTYVGTVAQVLSKAARERLSHRGPINLAFGTRHTLLELIGLLQVVLGSALEVMHTQPRPGDVCHSQADFSSLRSLIPNVVPVGLPDGLEATVRWMQRTTESR